MSKAGWIVLLVVIAAALAVAGWNLAVRDEPYVALLEGGFGAMAWSPDGRLLAVDGGPDGIWLWDTTTFEIRDTLIHNGDYVCALAWSSDGDRLAGVVEDGDDKGVLIWDVSSHARTVIQESTGAILCDIRWHMNQELAAGGDVQIWDAAGRLLAGPLIGISSVAAWSPDGSKVVRTIDGGGKIEVWTPLSGQFISSPVVSNNDPQYPDTFDANIFVWSPDGAKLAAFGRYDILRIWDGNTGDQLLAVSQTDGYVFRPPVTWSPDGTMISIGALQVWDAKSGQPLVKRRISEGYVRHIAWHPQSTLVAGVTDDAPGARDHVWVYDFTADRVRTLGRFHWVTGIAWNPAGDRLALRTSRGIEIWNPADN